MNYEKMHDKLTFLEKILLNNDKKEIEKFQWDGIDLDFINQYINSGNIETVLNSINWENRGLRESLFFINHLPKHYRVTEDIINRLKIDTIDIRDVTFGMLKIPIKSQKKILEKIPEAQIKRLSYMKLRDFLLCIHPSLYKFIFNQVDWANFNLSEIVLLIKNHPNLKQYITNKTNFDNRREEWAHIVRGKLDEPEFTKVGHEYLATKKYQDKEIKYPYTHIIDSELQKLGAKND